MLANDTGESDQSAQTPDAIADPLGVSATPTTETASSLASANRSSAGSFAQLPEGMALAGVAQGILDENFPQVRLGVAPAMSSIQNPAMSQAMTAASTAVTGILVNAGQGSVSPAVAAGGNLGNSAQPHFSVDDDFLRAITPPKALPRSAGVAPVTATIDAPARSTAMGLPSSTQVTSIAEVPSSNIAESQSEAALSQSDRSSQRVISPGRFPQLLDYVLPTSASSAAASIHPTALPRRAGPLRPRRGRCPISTRCSAVRRRILC